MESSRQNRIDLRTDAGHANETIRNRQLCFRLKQVMPLCDEYNALVKELFHGNIGEGSYMMPPLTVVGADKIEIGNHVFIMDGVLMMGSGGITIEDNVQLPAPSKDWRRRHYSSRHHHRRERCRRSGFGSDTRRRPQHNRRRQPRQSPPRFRSFDRQLFLSRHNQYSQAPHPRRFRQDAAPECIILFP